MAIVYYTGSGSEDMEAAINMSREYFFLRNTRVNLIARDRYYIGNTMSALAISGHFARRAP